MTILVSGEVNDEMFSKIIAGFLSTKGEKLTIYLNSEGGYTYSSDAIIHFINNNKDKIHLVAFGGILSAAFFIYFKSECSKEILPNTIGMVHFSYGEITINEKGKPFTSEDKLFVSEMKESKDKSISFLKEIGLNSSEINKVKKGEDLYFSYKRLLELGKQ